MVAADGLRVHGIQAPFAPRTALDIACTSARAQQAPSERADQGWSASVHLIEWHPDPMSQDRGAAYRICGPWSGAMPAIFLQTSAPWMEVCGLRSVSAVSFRSDEPRESYAKKNVPPVCLYASVICTR